MTKLAAQFAASADQIRFIAGDFQRITESQLLLTIEPVTGGTLARGNAQCVMSLIGHCAAHGEDFLQSVIADSLQAA